MSSASTTPGSAAAFDVTVALAAALSWGAADLALGGNSAVSGDLQGALGGRVAAAVPLVVLLRLARPWPRSLSALCLGALLVSVPLAVAGAVLVDKTHHRALGGVTFAFLALGAVVFGWFVALRLLPGGATSEGTPGGRLGRLGLVGVSSTAVLFLVAALLAGPAPARGAAVGVLSVVLATGAPSKRAPRALGIAVALVAAALVLAPLVT